MTQKTAYFYCVTRVYPNGVIALYAIDYLFRKLILSKKRNLFEKRDIQNTDKYAL